LDHDDGRGGYIGVSHPTCNRRAGAQVTNGKREFTVTGRGIRSPVSASCRRTGALALTEGVPVHIVAARLGDDPKTVLATYAHLLPRSDEQAAERVAALLTRREER
jgi:hypothetical protein